MFRGMGGMLSRLNMAGKFSKLGYLKPVILTKFVIIIVSIIFGVVFTPIIPWIKFHCFKYSVYILGGLDNVKFAELIGKDQLLSCNSCPKKRKTQENSQIGKASKLLEIKEGKSDRSISNGVLGKFNKIKFKHQLIIPSIGVNAKVFIGKDPSLLNKGVWHRPNSNVPKDGGNVVLTAHRFYYTGFAPNTFYALNYVQKGDKILLHWEGESFAYTVKEIKVVEPTEISVEENFHDDRITLYTCTPLWTSDKRLVVIGFKDR